MVLIILFLCAYIVPSIVLNFLQITHIKSALKTKAILLDSLDYKKAGNYALENLMLDTIQKCVEFGLFVFWVVFGLSFFWQWLQEIGLNGAWHHIAFLLLLLLIPLLVTLPLSFYQTFSIDKRYGFCKQSVGLFFIDLLKTSLLSIILGGVIFYVLLWVMDSFSFWWLGGFVLMFGVVVVANAIYPTLIAPLFNKFTPLEDTELKSRIEELLDKVGFKSNGIFVMDASKRDGRLNAYFGGIGRTKRVVLFDTLLEKISKDGLLAILGHELGHFKHKDILKNLATTGVFLFALFFLAAHLPESFFAQASLPQESTTTLALIFLLSSVISFWFLPLVGYFSRKAEYRADAFGATLSSKQCLANALVRLINENKSFPSSHWLYICFYYSHPPLLERLRALDYEI
ncbi:M48 family metallopeptidase [uncultured Helicobacter sp.]|uniref:M48 family metallopeptidase n=1 Tax=uncultured Helicobacter sp. TaxID=175537 RepID=UPI001C3AEFC7|nr:M48 family metallopeptidase [Candidatus Helicobacter avicola]